jgi:hypothetical protein
MQTSEPGQLLIRVKGEFLEMPGLQLTCVQAQRLWGLDSVTCDRLLTALLDQKFLMLGPDGRYRRVTDVTVTPHTGRCGRIASD